MEVQTREVEKGTEIRVETGSKVAVVVKTGSGERIYLPSGRSEDSGYYAAEPETLLETDYGYRVVHKGNVEEVEVIS